MLSGVIFSLSFVILSMWLCMLAVNNVKASKIRKHSDSLEALREDDPDAVGALLFANLYGKASKAVPKEAAKALFKQLVVHRDNPMFLNCIFKDLNIEVAKRLELINIIARCNTPLECLIEKGNKGTP